MDLVINTEKEIGLFCSEAIYQDSVTSNYSLHIRDNPNDSFPNFSQTSRYFSCTQYVYNKNIEDGIDMNTATTTISNFEMFFIPGYVIIFLLIILLVFYVFNWNNPWKVQ